MFYPGLIQLCFYLPVIKLNEVNFSFAKFTQRLILILFLSGLNPAECEVNFLRIVKNMDFYGIDMHNVVVCNQ